MKRLIHYFPARDTGTIVFNKPVTGQILVAQLMMNNGWFGLSTKFGDGYGLKNQKLIMDF